MSHGFDKVLSCCFVIHEGTRTGAPKVGGLLVRHLSEHFHVDMVVRNDGPLVPWLRQCAGESNFIVGNSQQFAYTRPFTERVEDAKAILTQLDPDFVYANSLGSSDFAVAAKALGKPVIMHVHEKTGEIWSLLRCAGTKTDIVQYLDAIVTAADDLSDDLMQMFAMLPDHMHNFGIALDFQEIKALAAATQAPPTNNDGVPFERGDRLVVGMVGTAAERKGADIFFETAAACPDADFIWIGDWRPTGENVNPAYQISHEQPQSNFYMTGPVDNPYSYVSAFDIFFLSSREDPNPLVLAEASVLDKTILAFGKTTAVADTLGRAAILCHGSPNVADAARVIGKLPVDVVRSEAMRELARRYADGLSIEEKIEPLVAFIGEVCRIEPQLERLSA